MRWPDVFYAGKMAMVAGLCVAVLDAGSFWDFRQGGEGLERQARREGMEHDILTLNVALACISLP